MATPDRQTVLRKIIEKEMPNYRLVEKLESPARSAVADAVTPDLATLRRKFLGQDAAAASPTRRARAAAAEEPQTDENDAIVLVEPKSSNPRDRGAGPKAVVISKGKIIGMQG
jgi:hypothetical protein